MLFNKFTSLALALCAVIALQSCSESANESVADSSAVVQQWVNYLSRDSSEFSSPGIPTFPQDLATHSQARAESFVLQAILHQADEHALPIPDVVVGFIAQIDRIALRSETSGVQADSAWRYNGIMRSSSFVDTNSGNPPRSDGGYSEEATVMQFERLIDIEPKQLVQRMALELAGVTDSEVWVGRDRLAVAQVSDNSNSCARTYRWEVTLSVAERIVLDITMWDCPQAQAVGEFNTWGQSSIEVAGLLITNLPGAEQISTELEGTAWMRQSWGNFPSSGGAVAIDTLQLRLGDSRWLDVSRSKRRSGRGPRTVSATLHVAGSVAQDIVLTWDDSSDAVVAESGNTYPGSILLHSSEHDLSVRVSVMNRLAESSDFGGSRLHVPVIVTGTHAGTGFLSFNALTN